MKSPAWLTARPIAHRGLHDRAAGRFENTIGAAEAAVAGGFAIECDVQLSSDGDAMVFHDHYLDRLTGQSGPVGHHTAAELGRLSVEGSADCISTLSAFLDVVAGRTPLVIEIKSRFDGDERLARRTVETLAERSGPVAVKSFDPRIVAFLKREAPALPRGIVAQSTYEGGEWAKVPDDARHALSNLLHWSDTEPDFLSWRHQDLPCAAPFLARRLAGTPVMTWTIRSPAEAARIGRDADQIVFEGYVPD